MSIIMRTHSGIEFDIHNPTKDMIRIEDIAHSLSLQCRFAGNCSKFYSVAMHSIVMADCLVSERNKAWALLHDAAEAYISDIPRPIKQMIPDIYEIENSILRVIGEKYGMKFDNSICPYPNEVIMADNLLLNIEEDVLCGINNEYLDINKDAVDDAKSEIKAWITITNTLIVKDLFLKRIEEIGI